MNSTASTPSASSSSSSLRSQSRPAKQARIEVDNDAETTSSSGSSFCSDGDSDSDEQDSEPHKDFLNQSEPGLHNGSPKVDLRSRVSSFLSKLAATKSTDGDGNGDKVIEILDAGDDDDVGDERNGTEDGYGQFIEMDLALGVLSEQGSDVETTENTRTVVNDNDSEEKSINNAEKHHGEVLSNLTSIARRNNTPNQRKAKRKIKEVG